MAEQLKIEIDVSAAKAALGQLTQTFKQFNATASSVGSGASQAISKLNSEMSKIKPLNPAILAGLTAMNTALSQLNGSGLSGVATQLEQIGRNASGVQSAANAIKDVSSALSGIKAPDGVKNMSVHFNSATRAMTEAQKAAKALARDQMALKNTIETMGRELINAAGFMTGLGVTAGNAVQAFQRIQQSGTSVTQVIGQMVQSFGKVGTALAGIALAAVAFNAIGSAISAIVGPVREATEKLTSFRNTMNSIRGAGEGGKALAGLSEVAIRTGQDVLNLAKNFQQFDVAAAAAGQTTQQSLTIFEGFSTAFTVLGTGVADADRAFKALAQMMAKGTVQMEELKGQLGDSAPAAAAAFSQALGITQGELMKLAMQGALVSKDVLPKVAAFLKDKYSGGLETALATITAQVNIFSTRWTGLLDAVGSGNFGGLVGGIAQGLKELNEALDSKALVLFARTLGDFLGLLSGSAIAALGGFVQGLLIIPNAFASAFQALVPFKDALDQTFNYLGGFTNAISYLGQGLGVFAALMGAQAIAAGLFGTKVTLAGIAAARAAGQATMLSRAIDFLKNGFMALFRVLLANPWTLLAAGIVVVAVAAYKYVQSLNDMTTVSGLAAKAAMDVNLATAAVKQGLESVAKVDAKKTLDDAADGLLSIKGAASQATVQLAQTRANLESYTSALNGSKSAVDQMNLQHEVFTDGLKSEAQALEAQKEAIQRRAEDMRELGVEFDMSSNKLKNLDRAIKDNREEQQNAALALADRVRREEEYQRSVEASIEAERAKADMSKEYKVAIDDESAALVKKLELLGMEKEKITETVNAYNALNETGQEREDRITREVEKLDELIQVQKRQIQAGQDQLAEAKREVEAGTRTEESYKRLETAILGIVAKRAEAVKGLVETRVGTEALRLTEAGLITDQEALTKALESTNAKHGETPGVVADSDKAIETLTGKVTTLGDKTEESGGAWETFKGMLKAVGDYFSSSGESAEKTVTGVEKAKTAIETATPVFASFKDTVGSTGGSFNEIANAATDLATSLPIVGGALTTLTGVVAAGAEPFAAMKTTLVEISTTFGNLQTTAPIVAQAFLDTATAVISGVEPTNAFASALARIPPTAEGIGKARDAIQEMLTYIVDSIPQIETSTEKLGLLTKAADAVAVGFENATTKGQEFIDKLSAVMEKANDAIQRMNELKRAAEEALDAARAAANAGGGGGNTQTGRDGGFSGALPGRQTVDPSVFSNAPQFRDGTANTSGLTSKVPGGGIPSILHPNEAVVPLPKGRSIPVDLNLTKMPMPEQVTSEINLAPLNDLTYTLNQLDRTLNSVVSSMAVSPATQMPEITVSPSIEVTASDVSRYQPTEPPQSRAVGRQSPDGLSTSNIESTPGESVSRQSSETRSSPINVTVNVTASDLDSFRRSEDQIARALSDKISRAKRRTSR